MLHEGTERSLSSHLSRLNRVLANDRENKRTEQVGRRRIRKESGGARHMFLRGLRWSLMKAIHTSVHAPASINSL